MAIYQQSPGVQVIEKNASAVTVGLSSTIGATVGTFQWGPVLYPMLIDNESTLVSTFGAPDANTYSSFFAASNFLAYTNAMYVNRVVGDLAKNATVNGLGTTLIKNNEEYEAEVADGTAATTIGTFAARYPGELANGLKISIADSGTFEDWEYKTLFSAAPDTSEYAASKGGSNDELHVVVIDALGKFTGTPGSILEKYSFVSKASDAVSYQGTNNYYASAIANQSQYIYWAGHPLNMTNWGNTATNTVFQTLSDTNNSVTPTTITTADATVTVNFATKPNAIYQIGDTISLVGFGPTAYNGNKTVTGATSTSVSFASTQVLNAPSTLGTIGLSILVTDRVENGTTIQLNFAGRTNTHHTVGSTISLLITSDTNDTVTLTYQVTAATVSSVTFASVDGLNLITSSAGLTGSITTIQILDVVVATAAVCGKLIATATFSDFGSAPFTTGEEITVTGATVSAYNSPVNTTWEVLSSTNTTVVFALAAVNKPANATIGGSITSAVYDHLYKLSAGFDDNIADEGDMVVGWDMFKDSQTYDVSLLVTGNASKQLSAYVVQNVADTRRDCVAFTSITASATGVAAPIMGNNSQRLADAKAFKTFDSTYAVIDSGYKYMYDKYNDKYRWIALNADTAGLCARVDATNDVWNSPAGMTKGQIKGAIKLSWNPTLTERDQLYPAAINPVINQVGQGTILFGDKTATLKPSAFDRINVRRMFLVLEKSIANSAKYQLFEINDELTRLQFVASVEPFLRDVKGRRGITDFKVIADETVNTPAVVAANEFRGVLLIKPQYSINFLTLTFVAVGPNVSFDIAAGV